MALEFNSRRSPVYARHGMVASSQPLASEIGLQILKGGGNAIDAAIAITAALNVTEPCSTGLGGDCFLLYYNAETKTVEALNGSGRSPQALTLAKAKDEAARRSGVDPAMLKALPSDDVHTVTVPGSAAGWYDAMEKWGTMKLSDVLAPAIKLAEEGFPVADVAAYLWKQGKSQLSNKKNGGELLINGEAPKPGQIFKNPYLANALKVLATDGKKGFYGGWPGNAIVEVVQEQGGVLSKKDLLDHESTFPEPISVKYKGVDVFEVPPNGQGITALMALNMLQINKDMKHNSTSHLHHLIEVMRLAFIDARHYVADTEHSDVPIKELLSEAYANKRRKLLDKDRAVVSVSKGCPFASSDTVSFQVVDSFGNAVSMVNSNYEGFGSGIVPKGCGFSLQNRGANFSLVEGHPNALEPNKRPYHTIIPGMSTKDGNFFATFTVMGGFMQPQGHVQVMSNILDFGMNPQAALNASRFCVLDGNGNGYIAVEDGVDPAVVDKLIEMGHKIFVKDGKKLMQGSIRTDIFGRGQVILKNQESGVLCAGSDGRADGLAIGW
mmetsp:Transcript_17104/g.22375  ORF Transcript_17104/g.22375 Transcript_17104/m.22375 type:complete len:552 (+) Transcript_17104:145-1800(+)